MTPSDHDLLQRFAREGSHAAFAELVTRHLDLVYSVARRHAGSTALADDIAQSVFLDLARQAARIARDTPLVAWLHVVARRTAIDSIRRDARRRTREHAVAQLDAMPTRTPSPDWSVVEPLLDEAVDSLPPADRTAILLRFFENKSLREVGTVLGTSDDTAQKRVTRALDQLRAFFLQRGIPLSSAALAADLSAAALHTAPAGLGATIAAGGFLPTTVTTAATLAMTTAQKLGLAATFVAAAVTVCEGVMLHRQNTALASQRAHLASLSADLTALRTARRATDDALARTRSLLTQRSSLIAAPPAADAALESQMRSWLVQVDRLRDFLKTQNRFAIPELQFLPEPAWFEIASAARLENDDDLRRAAARLRDRAQSLFNARLSRALYAYTRAHAELLPATPRALAAYFETPIDPSILDRYHMLQSGRVPDLPPRDRAQLIAVRTPVDIEHDINHWVGLNTYGNSGSLMAHNVHTAQREFRRAHPGESADAARLQPFLKWPVDVATLQNFLDRGQQGGSR